MSGNNGNMTDKSGRKSEWDDNLLSAEDNTLFEKIGNYLKGELDIEEVKSDPDFEATERAVKMMLSDYQLSTGNTGDKNFITEALASNGQEEKIKEEIRKIKNEISHNKLNEISSEWVREWHEKKQTAGKNDTRQEERREFIAASLDKDAEVRKSEPETVKKRRISRSLILRYVSLAAAVIAGAVIIISTLIPGSDPVKIYRRYYETVQAVSPVTRSMTSIAADTWAAAIMNYNKGEYQAASAGFSYLTSLDPASPVPGFYLGMAHLGMGEYNKAVSLLSKVAEGHGEYAKEARWYLGLAYLMQDNTEAASECFEILAHSPGYYSERSEKILRCLK